MGNPQFSEFFARIELVTSGDPIAISPLDFTLYTSVHDAPLAFDAVGNAWMFDYLSIPDGVDTVRVNVSADESTWPRSGPLSAVFAPVRFRITLFVMRVDGPSATLRTAFVDVLPWFLPQAGRTTVKGSYFIRWHAERYLRAEQPADLPVCAIEQSVDDFYDDLLPADLPPWPANLRLPGRFLLSTTKLTDFFGLRSGGTSFQSKSIREAHLVSLTAQVGRRLGLNSASLDRWTWKIPGEDLLQSGSLNAATVNRVARENLIPFRTHICASNFQKYLGVGMAIGMDIHFSAIMALWNQAHALRGTAGTPGEAQRQIMAYDIHAGGEPSDEYSTPWPSLRLLVFGEEANFNVSAALHLFLCAEQIAALTPGSVAHTFRELLDHPDTLKRPLNPNWNRGQDLTLEYHAEFIDYIRSVSANPNDWGVQDFAALGPVFVDFMPGSTPINPWEQLARDGDPCALTLEHGLCAIKRKLFLHSVLFVHDQVAKSSGLLARLATHTIRKMVGWRTRFYVGFGTNSRYCGAYSGNGLVFRDAFTEARQNAALVAEGLNPITPWMEDNDMIGYDQPDLIGHAEFLRSAAMMSLPAGDRWPEQPGPGAVGEHALYMNLANYRSDETDDLLYRGLVQIGSGTKAIDFFGGFGPDIRVVPADGENALFEINAWAPGVRTRHVRALTEMLRRVEDVLYPARPQRSPIAVLITRCSEVWDTTAEHLAYRKERIQLATPLAHAGHPLDYLDETDLLQGALRARNYLVLYLVDPNLPTAAVPIVRDWVGAGGTLAVLPGAAVEDEYGYPAGPELDALLGVAQRGHLYAKSPHQDRRGLKTKDSGWQLNPGEPLAIRVTAPALQFPGTAGTYAVYASEWAHADGAPLWAFHPILDGLTETLATWVAMGPDGAQISQLTFGEQQAPLPALTRRVHGRGVALCYGIMPGAMYQGSTAYDTAASEAPRRYDWRPDLRLFAIAPLLLTPNGALSPAASARIVNDDPSASQGVLRTHGAASVRHLQSDHGIALVVVNWARNPSLAPSRSFRVQISYLLPDPGLEIYDRKTGSGTPASLVVEEGRAVFEMELFSADVITFKLRPRPGPHPPDDAMPSHPRLGYIVCDIGKDTLSAVSTGNDPLPDFGGSVRDVEAHVKFLSA